MKRKHSVKGIRAALGKYKKSSGFALQYDPPLVPTVAMVEFLLGEITRLERERDNALRQMHLPHIS